MSNTVQDLIIGYGECYIKKTYPANKKQWYLKKILFLLFQKMYFEQQRQWKLCTHTHAHMYT
jgi:hypothetical protein